MGGTRDMGDTKTHGGDMMEGMAVRRRGTGHLGTRLVAPPHPAPPLLGPPLTSPSLSSLT